MEGRGLCSRYSIKAMQPSVSPTLICNQIGMGLTVTNVMNRTTETTGNGYIRYGGRGGGGGASFLSSGGVGRQMGRG